MINTMYKKEKNIKYFIICGIFLILIFPDYLLYLWGKNDPKNGNSNQRGNSLHNVYIPPGFSLYSPKKIEFKDGDISIDLYAKDFSQGNAAYAEIYAKKNDVSYALVKFIFDNSPVLFSRGKWGYRGFFAIPPETAPGKKILILQYTLNGLIIEKKFTLTIKKSEFPVYTTPLDLGKFSDTRKRTPEEIKFINESAEKKNRAFAAKAPDLVSSLLSHPRDIHYITSPFWSKRVYMQYKIKNGEKVPQKSSSNIHKGIDLKGEKGTPVYTITAGTIMLAEELYYEGFMVIINHGNDIISYFMHLNGVNVKKDDTVKAGDIIGHVGSTGVSTAAHLHVSMIIKGIHVDPLSLLYLPVKELSREEIRKE